MAMKLARYWLPTTISFALGGILAWCASGIPFGDWLASARIASHLRTAPSEPPPPTPTAVSSTGIPGDSRISRLLGALQESRSLKRRSQIHQALRNLGSGDLEALLVGVEALKDSPTSREAAKVILEYWFELDAESAQNWIRTRPKNQSYWVLWAKFAPKSALHEAAMHSDGPRNHDFVRSAMTALAGRRTDEMTELLLGLPSGDVRNSLLLQFVWERGEKEPEECLRFVQAQPASSTRAAMLVSVLSRLTASNPLEAAKLVPELFAELPTDSSRAKVVEGIVAALARTEPPRALEWLNSLPPKERNSSAYTIFARVWAMKEPTQALEWCLANEVGPATLRDTVTNAVHANSETTLQLGRVNTN